MSSLEEFMNTEDWHFRPTIMICTADMTSARFLRCLNAVLDTTGGCGYDLRIFDNRKSEDFHHPTEINKAIEISEGPLIILDDDVVVKGGWLQSMLAAADPDVGIVGCSVSRKWPEVWSRGVSFNKTGQVFNWKGDIKEPTQVPALCSCCWLINTQFIKSKLEYKKYYFDINMCLEMWNCGFKVVVVPDMIFHDPESYTNEVMADKKPVLGYDRQYFMKNLNEYQDMIEQNRHRWPGDMKWS